MTVRTRLKRSLPESLKRTIRKAFDRFARRRGYERVVRAYPVDFRGLAVGPAEAQLRAAGRPVLLNVPLRHCRGLGLMAFPLTPDSPHPYIMTALRYVRTGQADYSEAPLARYYQLVQPGTAADLFGLDAQAGNAGLAAMAALEAAPPWRTEPGPHVRHRRRQLAYNEMAQHHQKPTGDDVWIGMGPMPEARGHLEMQRICYVVDSITANGYAPHSTKAHVHCAVLTHGDRYVALITSGQHRAAALAALGFTEVGLHIRPNGVISRESVLSWPAVTAGFLSEAQALEVFDRVFRGAQPACVAAVWPAAPPPGPRDDG